MTLLTHLVVFLFICLAAKKIGEWFSGVGLPYITGYLLVGALSGPFIFDLLPAESLLELRFVEEISLAVIALLAGSELYLKEVRSRFNSISRIIAVVILVAIPMASVAIYLLTEYIPFTQGMPVTSRLAVAILGGVILLALSPPSTIAVIKEVRAKGQFSRTLLGVTVSMDVIIVILFAVAVAVAATLLNNTGFNASFIVLLLIDLTAAVFFGWLVGLLLTTILTSEAKRYLKYGLLLGIGYAIFAGSHSLTELTYGSTFEIHIEPILTAMIAGFYIVNYTNAREQLEEVLHKVSPAIYVAFFTLTGVGIKLDMLVATWGVALALFAIRLIGISIGGFAGSKWAGESNKFASYAGLALVTQAGIALGLSREVAVEFPALGDAFATLVISVVILNEIFGPILLKFALKQVGEAAETADPATYEGRRALLVGVEDQSIELARQLTVDHWEVVFADQKSVSADRLELQDYAVYVIDMEQEDYADPLFTEKIDAVVAFLPNDECNFRILEEASDRGINRLVVRPSNLANASRFRELGALTIDPTSAMVYLLEQTVRAPKTTSILLHQDTGREMVQVTVSNPDIDGLLLRELRLPTDVLFVDVTRGDDVLLPNGYTRLRLEDEVTLVGRDESLEEAVIKLGY